MSMLFQIFVRPCQIQAVSPSSSLIASLKFVSNVVFNEMFTEYQIYDSSVRFVGEPVGLVDYPK
jgi:hypothetical protein